MSALRDRHVISRRGEQLPTSTGTWRRRPGGYEVVKGCVETLYAASASSSGSQRGSTLLHPGRRQTEAGWVGELHPTLLDGTGEFELDLETLLAAVAGARRLRGRRHVPGDRSRTSPSRWTRRSRWARSSTPHARRPASSARRACLRRLSRRPGRRGSQSVAIHLAFQSPERTLTEERRRQRANGSSPPSPSASGPSCARRHSDLSRPPRR